MRRRNGFTIVETSLVLAIGGLILLMVFIALPGVFRNQRDAERRDDVLLFLNKLKNFQANNNRGALPSGDGEIITISGSEITFGQMTSNTWKDFYQGFFDKSFTDPSSGELYNWKIIKECKDKDTDGQCDDGLSNDFAVNNFTMYIIRNAICDGEKAIYSANPRNVAVRYKLEGGGIFCANT